VSVTAPVTTADYPADYVQVTFTTDAQTLADDAVANLQTTWTDWEANDGDMEVVLIETLAPYAAAAAANAAQMPPAAFIALGTKLYGISYSEGAPAQTTVTLTFQDSGGGYYVPAGSEFDLGGYAFTTVADVTSSAGSSTATGVPVIAGDVGTAFNDLTAANWSNVTLPIWVTGLTTEAPTAGGADPQNEYDYLNQLSRELQLRGRMLVTLPDFEIAAVDTPGVGRAYAETTGPRAVEIWLTDLDGNPVPTSIKTDLTTEFTAAVLSNVTFTISDATYATIAVTYSAVALPGFDPTALTDSINAALSSALAPMTWGGPGGIGMPGGGTAAWVNENTVRLNKIVAIIGTIPGVAYVVANSVQINGAAADFVMPGTVALPQPGTMTGNVTIS
jgi:hypothetical protein